MATKLDKTLIRETDIIVDNRNLVISLTEDQHISFKLKGMKTKSCESPIQNVFNLLMGTNPDEDTTPTQHGSITVNNKENSKQEKSPGSNFINIQDFRSKVLTNPKIPYDMKVKLESIIKDL
jgi:hypothetical protein